MRRVIVACVVALATLVTRDTARAKDLGDILVQKGLITPDELRQAREEEKQKAAAEESRREAITAKLPKWLEVIQPFGDLRTRYEGFYERELVARNRFRMRARFGLNANVSDEIAATVRLVSGNPDDPISANQDFTRTFTKKPVNFDQAYLVLRPGKSFHIEPGWVTITGGKFGVNAYRASELVFDDDLAPEGATETLNLIESRSDVVRGLRVNGFQWIIDEIANSDDPWMAGGQIVTDLAPLGDDSMKMTFSFADYHYENLNNVARKFLNRFNDPPTNSVPNPNFNSQLANSNRVDHFSNGAISGFDSGFNIVNATAEANFLTIPNVGSGGLFGDFAYNTQADGKNVGFYVGAGIGKAGRDWYHDGLKNQWDWGMSYTYAWVEQDAVLSMFSYSDIDYVQTHATQKGSSNVTAHIIRVDYMLLPNLQLTAKAHFINALDKSSANVKLEGNPTLVRTQLDATLKF